ncbi:MAG TPA: lysophospholipid acyltransferase family protein [Syntrophorhabdaceae bacterium]|jgi:predicted LPLAT superfamily acyltransferase
METADSTPTRPGAPQWTSRSIGSTFGHRFFYLVIKYAGREFAYFVLSFVVPFYVFFAPSTRKKSDYYLSRRFKEKGRVKRLLDRYLLYLNLGKALIDRAVIGILGEEKITWEFSEKEAILPILKEGRGMILMTAHVGCWQTAMSTLRFLGAPVHLLLQREEGDIDLHYYEHAGIPCPYGIIDPRGYMGGVLEIIALLKRGEVLCVMGDRLLGSPKGAATVDFMGGKVLFPFSAFKIAAATGAPIVVFFSHKSSSSGYTLEIAAIIRVPHDAGRSHRDFLPYVGRFAEALESYTTAHPYQFFNFYDMWSHDLQTINQKRGKHDDHQGTTEEDPR